MRLSVIIPTYNEEQRLPQTLEEINKYLLNQTYDSEIIVADGGSKDRTIEIVKETALEIRNLKLLEVREGHGKGQVVREGMLKSQGDFRVFTDADDSTSMDHIEKMWPLFEQGFDIVIGSRDSKDAPDALQAVRQPFWKRFLGDVGNILIQLLAVWGIWDTQCGFKCFTKKAAQDIFSRARISGWAFDVEALSLAKKLGDKIGIVPVYWVNDPNSKVNLRGYLNFLKELMVIKWNFIRKKYNL